MRPAPGSDRVGVMSVAEALVVRGGVATRAQLILDTSRGAVDRALQAGQVVALARGRYAASDVEAARALAHELSAVLSHRHAALHWGWAVKLAPVRPDVTVPRNRRLRAAQTSRVVVHRATLHADDVADGVTSRERTLVDCLRTLPEDEALAVADSALRDGFSGARLRSLVRDARGPGALRARRLAAMATPEAANPFESVLRWLASRTQGLRVRPQVPIHEPEFVARPDLVDEDLRIVLEADSFAWHGGRADLARDARRYNDLAVRGWLVLRFSWDDVMHHPEVVLETLRRAVARRTNLACCPCAVA